VHNEFLKDGERAIIVAIKGNNEFQNFLMSNGITLGTIFTKNYSPTFAKLINFSIGNKMLSLKATDFELLEFVKI